jgi:hypothetical protein
MFCKEKVPKKGVSEGVYLERKTALKRLSTGYIVK